MKKNLQIWGTLFLLLFLLPILMNFLPNTSSFLTTNKMTEPLRIVYASNVFEEEIIEDNENLTKNVLIYFAHNHEAFEPITEAVNGKVAASHRTENIMKFGGKLKDSLQALKIDAAILPVDNAEELIRNGWKYGQSYHSIRPFVQEEITKHHYDLIIDLHRDSATHEKTTVTFNGENYARIAFVIGLEHDNYQENEEKAIAIKEEMEKIVPGITRSIIRKSGKGVDGKYNQDLHGNIVLVELGGRENNEGELNRTIAVISEAIEHFLQ